MYRTYQMFLPILLLIACTNEGSAPQKTVVFELACKPIERIVPSLKGAPVFSSELLVLRYGAADQPFNIRLGEDYVLNQINPIAVIRGKAVPEPVYRFGRTRGGERYSYAVERETMGVAQYTYVPASGLLTEVYLNFEPRDVKDIAKGGTEATIVQQAICNALRHP
jgi:hypothetical protein